jgi:glucose-6-phosphate dehydrogenase assembly protein OpcA
MVLWGKAREASGPADLSDDGGGAPETMIVLELNGKDARNGDAAILPLFCATTPKHEGETDRNGST